MTRKDYELIAATIRDMTLVDCPTNEALAAAQFHRANAARRFAASLRKTNPAFDAARFLSACGVEA